MNNEKLIAARAWVLTEPNAPKHFTKAGNESARETILSLLDSHINPPDLSELKIELRGADFGDAGECITDDIVDYLAPRIALTQDADVRFQFLREANHKFATESEQLRKERDGLDMWTLPYNSEASDARIWKVIKTLGLPDNSTVVWGTLLRRVTCKQTLQLWHKPNPLTFLIGGWNAERERSWVRLNTYSTLGAGFEPAGLCIHLFINFERSPRDSIALVASSVSIHTAN